MAAWVQFYCLNEDIAEKVHNLGSDQLVVFLTNTAPTASTNTVLANITEISYANCSSRNITTTSSSQTNGAYKLVLQDLTLTASGTVGPFQYVGIYNDTSTSDSLLGYYDYGSAITLASGEQLAIDFDGTNGVFAIAYPV